MYSELKSEAGEIKNEYDQNAVSQEDKKKIGELVQGCFIKTKSGTKDLEAAYYLSVIDPEAAKSAIGEVPDASAINEGLVSPGTNRNISAVEALKTEDFLSNGPIINEFFPGEREKIQAQREYAVRKIKADIEAQGRFWTRVNEGGGPKSITAVEAKSIEYRGFSKENQFNEDSRIMGEVAGARIMYPDKNSDELGLDVATLTRMERMISQHKIECSGSSDGSAISRLAEFLSNFRIACPEEFGRLNPVGPKEWELFNKNLAKERERLSTAIRPEDALNFARLAASVKILGAKEVEVGENGLELAMPGEVTAEAPAEASPALTAESIPVPIRAIEAAEQPKAEAFEGGNLEESPAKKRRRNLTAFINKAKAKAKETGLFDEKTGLFTDKLLAEKIKAKDDEIAEQEAQEERERQEKERAQAEKERIEKEEREAAEVERKKQEEINAAREKLFKELDEGI